MEETKVSGKGTEVEVGQGVAPIVKMEVDSVMLYVLSSADVGIDVVTILLIVSAIALRREGDAAARCSRAGESDPNNIPCKCKA